MGVRDWFRRTPAQETRGAVPLRGVKPAARYYNAADTGRLLSSWSTTTVSADDVTRRDLKTLRVRSREQYRNNDYASRFVQLVRSNVVGPQGVVIQATVANPPEFAAKGGPLDHSVNDAIEAAFAEWSRASNCDVAGRLSWVQIQAQMVGQVAIDGEAIAVIHTGPVNRFGFALQLIDPVQLDVDLNDDPARAGRRIVFGIELDAVDRPVAYWFKQAKPSDYSVAYNGAFYTRVEADRVLHLFVPEFVGQKRGMPMLATALYRLKMLDGYEDAAITAARVGAAKMGFFTSAAGDGYTGTDTDSDGAVITDVAPGTFEQLPNGTTFTPFDPDYPHAQFGAFVKSCLRGISAGLGVSYASISGDLEGVNYSSIRAGVLEDREAWKAFQTWFVDAFVRPVYETWVRLVHVQRLPILPGGGRLRDSAPDRYLSASYQPRRWAWVDPQKDTDANIAAINAGLKSRGEVIREQGRDPEDVWRELAAEQARLSQLGILQPAPAPAPATNDNGGSNDDPQN